MEILVRQESPCHHCAQHSQQIEFLSDSAKPHVVDDCSLSGGDSCVYQHPVTTTTSGSNLGDAFGGIYIEGEDGPELVGVNLADLADGYVTISSQAEATRDAIDELSERLRALEAVVADYGINVANEIGDRWF